MKQNKAYIIGVTGGVGSGKSTALDYLCANYDCVVIKADDVGNEVKLKGHVCYDELVGLLGENVLNFDGEINKAVMASIIFEDDNLLTAVNNIIHPAVRTEIEKFIDDNLYIHDFIFIEAALLVEADYFPLLNELWEIRSDSEERIERLKESRGYSVEKSLSIMASQNNDKSFYKEKSDEYGYKSERTDFYGYRLITNDSSEEDLFESLDYIMEGILNGK